MANAKKDKQEEVCVVGFGWVGQANALALSQMGYAVSWYDPAEPEQHYKGSYEQLTRVTHMGGISPGATCVVCVGDKVDEGSGQNIGPIQGALEALQGRRIVLRSTVLPQNIAKLPPFDVYLPEFLHEKAAVAECLHPRMVVIGTDKHIAVPPFVDQWAGKAQKAINVSMQEAAYIKYMSNCWAATKVAFANEMGGCIHAKAGYKAAELAIDFLFKDEPYMRYGRAYGGHCLPKDTLAFALAHPIAQQLRGTIAANKLHADFPLNKQLSEHFSFWGKDEV